MNTIKGKVSKKKIKPIRPTYYDGISAELIADELRNAEEEAEHQFNLIIGELECLNQSLRVD